LVAVARRSASRYRADEAERIKEEVRKSAQSVLSLINVLVPREVPRLNPDIPFEEDCIYVRFDRQVFLSSIVYPNKIYELIEKRKRTVELVRINIDRIGEKPYGYVATRVSLCNAEGYCGLLTEDPEGLVLLFTPEFFGALKSATIESVNGAGAKWFEALVDSVADVMASEEVKHIDPRDLLSPKKRPGDVTVSLWDPLNDGISTANIIAKAYSGVRNFLIVYLKLGRDTYVSFSFNSDESKKRSFGMYATINKKKSKLSYEYIRQVFSDSNTKRIGEAITTFLETYKVLKIALEYTTYFSQ